MKLFRICLGILMLICSQVHSTVIANPSSNHKLFQSYGLLFDPQSMVLFRSGSRALSAVGGSVALWEWLSDWESQLVFHSSIVTSLEGEVSKARVHVETMDVRIGMAYDMQFNQYFRGAIIWTHQSGHVADNVPDPDLIGPDLGNEQFDFRLIRDVDRRWRIGAGLRPYVITKPVISSFGADEFVEWYPRGISSNPHEFTEFCAVGLEQYGVHNIITSINAQVGWVAGPHFDRHPGQSIRFVLGYYSGYDPRLKYFQFKDHKEAFGYVGSLFDF